MEQGKRKVQAKNLTKRFGELLVLDDISFDVMEGEFLCIVGPTGCGKTTFLNCLTKLYDITNGEILVDGAPINCKKNNISYILQESSAMEWLTVEQNIQFGLGVKNAGRNEKGTHGRNVGTGRAYGIQKLLSETIIHQYATEDGHSESLCHVSGTAAYG